MDSPESALLKRAYRRRGGWLVLPGSVVLILTTLLSVRSDEQTNSFMVAGIAEFTAAYAAWDGDRFNAAAKQFRKACRHSPEDPACFYWLGATEFHRMLQQRNTPGSESGNGAADPDDAMTAAVDALRHAIALDPRHAESHALLGTIYGLKIDGNLFRALRFGPRVQKHRAQALQWGAKNPRVRYLLGVCQFHTAKKPSELREALASLQLAEQLFEAEAQHAPGPLEPRWGHGNCLTFLGRTHEKLGEHTAAAEYFRKALLRHPADHLAAEGLARVGASE